MEGCHTRQHPGSVSFTNVVREAAAQRRVTANELVFTAVSHVLEAENAQAA